MTEHAELCRSLSQSRAHTDSLFSVVHPEALYERPIPERHRIVFYLGHLEAFDWNLLAPALNLPAFHATFDRLFSFGIDPDSSDLPADEPSDWPSIQEVHDYNARVREALDPALDRAPLDLLHVALEHRWMHAETFAYIMHHLPFEQKLAPEHSVAPSGPAPQTRMIEIPDGPAILGRDPGNGFGWDNEYALHRVEVPGFAVSQYKVTNGEYLEFVQAGASAPHFWACRDGQWCYHGMFDDIPLPLNWPVYVTYDQAQAYARWKHKSLPTEAQFHRAAYTGKAHDLAIANADFQSWDPEPITSTPPNSLGVSQAIGNGWEWTATQFAPFPGFQPFPFYPGYSANFFDGRHFVLKGGSPRTAGALLRPSFRNWFRPSYPYIYATFRLLEN